MVGKKVSRPESFIGNIMLYGEIQLADSELWQSRGLTVTASLCSMIKALVRNCVDQKEKEDKQNKKI